MNLKASVADIVSGNVEEMIRFLSTIYLKLRMVKKVLYPLGNPKYNKHLYTSNSSIVLVKDDYVLESPVSKTVIGVKDPNESFSKLLSLLE